MHSPSFYPGVSIYLTLAPFLPPAGNVSFLCIFWWLRKFAFFSVGNVCIFIIFGNPVWKKVAGPSKVALAEMELWMSVTHADDVVGMLLVS